MHPFFRNANTNSRLKAPLQGGQPRRGWGVLNLRNNPLRQQIFELRVVELRFFIRGGNPY